VEFVKFECQAPPLHERKATLLTTVWRRFWWNIEWKINLGTIGLVFGGRPKIDVGRGGNLTWTVN